MTYSVESVIAEIKTFSDFWDEDPAVRAQPDYTGFRSIRNNRVSTDYSEISFPVLILDPDETKFEELNRGIAEIGLVAIVSVMTLAGETDSDITSQRLVGQNLLFGVLNATELPVVEKILLYEDVLSSSRCHAISTKVEIC